MGYLNPHTHQLETATRGKSLAELTAELRELNTTKGWRTNNTYGDYVALLHTEVAEMTEAYRDHVLDDATKPICGRAAAGEEPCPEHGPSKPEGVGSEIADTVIRLLDMCDVFGITVFDMDAELADVAPFDFQDLATMAGLVTFGDWTDWLHGEVVDFRRGKIPASHLLRDLATVADRYGIDLTAEVTRKIAHNWTRPYQHGGRTLTKDTDGGTRG
jgi:NTP pyrophosphatase (non-canonical NTP hydrolase)